MARGLKPQSKEVERVYYLCTCSENKGVDQLLRAADLSLNVYHMQKVGFLLMQLNLVHSVLSFQIIYHSGKQHSHAMNHFMFFYFQLKTVRVNYSQQFS